MAKKNGPVRGLQQTAAAGITEVVPWSVPVVVDQIPEGGLHRDLEAPEAARVAIAKLAEVRDVAHLTATFDVAKSGGNIHVTGRIKARLGQTCVVSLEPMETAIDEPVDLSFKPAPAGAVLAEAGADDPRRTAAEDAPEPLVGNIIDLGAIASELLVLAIDPYPRKEGAEFTPPVVADTRENPFAALAALKKEPGNRNN